MRAVSMPSFSVVRRAPRRILLVRPRAAGDVLLATPILAALRETFPEAWIALAVRRNMVPLVEENPHADEILVIDAFEDAALPAARRALGAARFFARLRGERFDLAIDLHGGPRSALVTFATGARVRVGYDTPGRRAAYTVRVPRFEIDPDGKQIVRSAVRVNAAVVSRIGVRVRDESLVLRVPERARRRARAFLDAEGLGSERPLVLVNPAAKWATKAWPAERYAAVARRLVLDRGADVVVLWGPGERATAERVVAEARGAGSTTAIRSGPRILLAPEGDLGDVAALVEVADLVVGTDSGVSHIAAALGIPSVTLFGPTNPTAWHPYDPARHVPICHRVPCSFCNLTACAWHACMNELPMERVLEACVESLQRTARSRGAPRPLPLGRGAG